MTGLLVSFGGTICFVCYTVYVVAKPILSTKAPSPNSLAGMIGGTSASPTAAGGGMIGGAADPRRKAVFGGVMPSAQTTPVNASSAGVRAGRAPLVPSNQAVLAHHARNTSLPIDIRSRYDLSKRSDLKVCGCAGILW